MKLTFKRGALGSSLQRVGHPYAQVEVRLGGRVIGNINPPSWQTKDHKWGIQFRVSRTPTTDAPCEWRWFVVKNRFDNEADARTFITNHTDEILKLNLYILPY